MLRWRKATNRRIKWWNFEIEQVRYQGYLPSANGDARHEITSYINDIWARWHFVIDVFYHHRVRIFHNALSASMRPLRTTNALRGYRDDIALDQCRKRSEIRKFALRQVLLMVWPDGNLLTKMNLNIQIDRK